MHASSRCIETQSSSCQRSKAVQDVEGIDCELLLVASHPSLPTTVHPSRDSSPGIEFFLRQHSVLLTVVANQEHRWESVGELKDAGSADERGEIGNLGNGSCDDPCENPIDWN
jgi:hypothetical protein